jgi:hypothetical protein
MRYFVIICLKRSNFAESKDYTTQWFRESNLTYWRPNRAGYTNNRAEAGIYSSADLDECAGDGADWFAQPLYRNERGYDED